jgi:AAA ATPase domain/Transcriptional regulatory protein, C terminal
MKYFSSFRFEENDGTLFRGAQQIPLTRKAGDLLRCLLERAGAVTTHHTILSTVWRGTHVQPGNIKVLVRELRRALEDDPRQPRFIKSEPGRGYSFLAPAGDAPPPGVDVVRQDRTPIFFNRRDELETLKRCLAAASESECRLVLIEGEHGAGKTALCDAFLHLASRSPAVWLSYGQCFEQSGSGEPYCAVLNALDQLTRQFPTHVPAALLRHAPAWLGQLPQWSELAVAARANPSNGHRSSRMIRELLSAFDELSRDITLVLVLEDLHWGDLDTIELLRALGRHHSRAKYLIVATYDACEVSDPSRALARLALDLQSSQACVSLSIGPLREEHVRGYLEARFGSKALGPLTGPLCQVTGGNPLRIVATVDALVATGRILHQPEGWHLESRAENSIRPESANDLSTTPPIGSGSLTSMAWMGREGAGAWAFGATQK